jgi:hypothetical protein
LPDAFAGIIGVVDLANRAALIRQRRLLQPTDHGFEVDAAQLIAPSKRFTRLGQGLRARAVLRKRTRSSACAKHSSYSTTALPAKPACFA